MLFWIRGGLLSRGLRGRSRHIKALVISARYVGNKCIFGSKYSVHSGDRKTHPNKESDLQKSNNTAEP